MSEHTKVKEYKVFPVAMGHYDVIPKWALDCECEKAYGKGWKWNDIRCECESPYEVNRMKKFVFKIIWM